MAVNFCISTAPMLDYSDTHCRFFWRLFSRNTLLYSEMIHANAIVLGDRERALQFHDIEHPIALQLGGNDPASLAQAAVYAKQAGYDEINLNIGCPSDRVQSGQFGACLMRQPHLVAQCVAEIKEKTALPVTVKTRIGVDHDDSYEFLSDFISIVASQGCKRFIIHARKAWLKGLSPKQNRDVPPLMYDRVYQLKKAFPQLQFVLNGGVKTCSAILEHLKNVDGVMVGREAISNPFFLSEIENYFFKVPPVSLETVFEKYVIYLEKKLKTGIHVNQLMKPLMNLFHGKPHARQWRSALSNLASNFSVTALHELFYKLHMTI